MYKMINQPIDCEKVKEQELKASSQCFNQKKNPKRQLKKKNYPKKPSTKHPAWSIITSP